MCRQENQNAGWRMVQSQETEGSFSSVFCIGREKLPRQNTRKIDWDPYHNKKCWWQKARAYLKIYKAQEPCENSSFLTQGLLGRDHNKKVIKLTSSDSSKSIFPSWSSSMILCRDRMASRASSSLSLNDEHQFSPPHPWLDAATTPLSIKRH